MSSTCCKHFISFFRKTFLAKHREKENIFFMANNKSEHILNTSSNLLGFCLVVLTSLKISKYSSVSIIDELMCVGSLFLIISSVFSFLSIRAEKENLSVRYEKIAENIFITALIFVFLITFLVAFSIIF